MRPSGGPATPSAAAASPRQIAAAVMIAVAIGAAAVFESIIALHRPGRLQIPLVATLGLLVTGIGVWFLVQQRHWIFRRRFEFAIAILVLAGACGGLDIGKLDPTDVAIAGVGVLWLFAAVVEQLPIRVPLPVLVLVLLLMACSILSVSNGGFGSIIAQRSLINKLLLLVMLSTFCAADNRWKFAGRIVLAAALFSAVVALATGIAHVQTGATLTAENLEQFQFKSTPFGHMLRVTAFSATTQTLAHVLLFGTAMACFIPMRPWWRMASVAVLGAAIGWTFSTGGYVVFVIIVVVAVFLRRPEHSLHYITLIAGMLCVAYLAGGFDLLYDRVLEPIGGKGFQDRVGYLRTGFEAIGRHPVVGTGLRNIGRMLPTPVHNAYVQFAAEIGIAGGLMFTAVVGYLIVKIFWIVRSVGRSDTQAWMKAFLLGMIAVGIHLLSEPFYDNYMSWAFMGIAAGVVAGHDHRARSLRRPDEVVRFET